MGNWAELPQDLLLLILQKLFFGKDYYRFACVCRFWTSVATIYLRRYAPPCLIVPAPGTTSISNSKSRLLLASPVGKDIAKEQDFLPQIRLPLEEVYIGSHQGWLVMLNNEMTIYLLNPFSDTRIHLPGISEFHLNDIDIEWPLGLLDIGYMWPRLNFCKSKVVLSTIPTASNCFVLVIYGYKKLAFCKVGDEDWTYIDNFAFMVEKLANFKFFFMDAIYFKGQFLVLSVSGEIFGFDLTVSKPTLTKIYGNGFDTNPPVHPVLSHDPQPHWYLVECGGQLFRILQVEERRIGEAKSNDILFINEFASDPLDELYCRVSYCSYWFEVCKLDTRSESTPSWIHVDNFEGDAVFLGRNQSFSLSNPHEFGYKGNRIYFTDHRSVNNDMGVFDLDDFSVEEPLYNTNSKLVLPSAIWVIPKPF